MDPFIAAMIADATVQGVGAITRGGPRRQYKWNKKAAQDTQAMNRENALWALEQNKKIQEEQRLYDSPAAQMERYKAAGLNPHLIYGSGGSAGGAMPIDFGGIAPSRVEAPDAGFTVPMPSFMGAMQTQATIQGAQQRVQESVARTALLDMQKDIAKTNPMLNPSVAEWVSNAMMETARLKTMESRTWLADAYGTDVMKISQKINMELEAMATKLGLYATDQQIRNQILESKEFENAIKEIQTRWLKDAEITPEHIRQGLMLILGKMLGH